MAKIKNDKYYTSDELSKYCIEKTKEIIGEENITEWLEPSAGAGAFLNHLPPNTLAYDVEPEDDRIVKQDYLELDLEYKKGRCIIGNPPFGNGNTLSVKFFKKSIQLGDYIGFIQPISQLNNNQQMYEFDLIHSENLGEKIYTNIELHCCFNIYKRTTESKKKQIYKLKDIDIVEIRKRKGKITKDVNYSDFDIGICNVGNGSIGKETKYIGQYVNEIYVKINNIKYKDDIINIIRNTNWKDKFKGTSKAYISVTKLYKYIKEQIPEIE
mgnify:CR=1 FL=1